MREYLIRTSHSPRPLPSGRWQMTQRWNDLLFAHWPVPAAEIAPMCFRDRDGWGLCHSGWTGSKFAGFRPYLECAIFPT